MDQCRYLGRGNEGVQSIQQADGLIRPTDGHPEGVAKPILVEVANQDALILQSSVESRCSSVDVAWHVTEQKIALRGG